MMLDKKTILVTGASGSLGGKIIDFLMDSRSSQVIVGTRAPDKNSGFADRGVEVRRVDFDSPSSCETAFKGIDHLVIVSTDAVAEPGKRIRQHQCAIEAAVGAGVRHIIYTSFSRSDAGSPIPLCADHHATEQALKASGLSFTALRNSLYAEAILRRLPAMLSVTDVPGLAGGGGIPYIAREDCARAAAAVADADRPPLGAVELTGPEVIDDERLTALVSRITGRHLRFVPMEAGALVNHMVATGIPLARAAARVALDTAVATGYLEITSDAVAELTGKPAMRMHDFLVSAGVGGMPA